MRAGAVEAAEDGIGEVGATPVREQLERILASSAFGATDRGRRFLRFVVEETLAGRSERIKAFTVAVEVYGRDESFDAQGDPLVRLEAGRLRRALEHYYLTEGARDPVEISIPKGRYHPLFVIRDIVPDPTPAAVPPPEAPPAPARPPATGRSRRRVLAAVLLAAAVLGAGLGLQAWLRPAAVDGFHLFRPSVLVAPFAARGTEPEERRLALGVADQIVTELTRFREIVVFGRGAPAVEGPDQDALQRARDLHATHLLEGSVSLADDQARIYVRLDATADGATVWSATFDRNLRAENLFAVQDQIAAEVVTRIAQPFGEIARAEPPAGHRPDDVAAYRCAVDFYAYRRSLAREEQPRVVACLEQTVARHPDYATGWAMLAMVWVDSDRFSLPVPADAPKPLASAIVAARRAIELDSSDVRAWEALMLASYLSGEVTEGHAAGERALTLNPNDLELVGEYGMRLAMAGEWDRGTAMIRSVLDRDPAGARFHLSVLALDSIRTGQYLRALELLDRMGSANPSGVVEMVRAAALGHLGRIEEARTAAERAERSAPGILTRRESEFGKRNLQEDTRRALIEGWRKAGLTRPEAAASIDPPSDTGKP